jgi:hypothetical protein
LTSADKGEVMIRRLGSIVAVVALTSAAAWLAPPPGSAASPRCPLPVFCPGSQYHPQIDPRNFGPNVDNPLFPLRPGRTFVYAGVKDGQNAIDIFAPSSRTRRIDGVTTRIVEDRLYLDGVLEERTSDYYAQDRCGNVWYFGEDTAELDENGNVLNTDGSFHAGVDGAQPGVFMQRHPQIGRQFRQEWLAGEAEDVFTAIVKKATVSVPLGSFKHALLTQETTALEPGIVDHKYYVRGIGEVTEVSVKGAQEKLELVEIIS